MKNFILYYFFILPISYLPFPVLYFISDIIFLIIYRVVGYRRKVVQANINNSFPEKSEKEIKRIEKRFYRHLCDLLVESLKTFTISAEKSLERMQIRNPELPNRFFKEGKSIVTVGGHNGNWELYAVACAMQIDHSVVALYTRLSNKFFDKLMRESRGRFGLKMIPTTKKEELYATSEGPRMSIFGIDQCPRKSQRAYWMKFLNQETAVQFGAEKFARDHNLPVILGNIRKIKRGYYEVEYELVCENPSKLPMGAITEKSTKMLEEKIRQQPEYWLWSHKRWKHSKKACIAEQEKLRRTV